MKKLTYRRSSKGIAEQYGINLPKQMIIDMKITPDSREVNIKFDTKNKAIIITKNVNNS